VLGVVAGVSPATAGQSTRGAGAGHPVEAQVEANAPVLMVAGMVADNWLPWRPLHRNHARNDARTAWLEHAFTHVSRRVGARGDMVAGMVGANWLS
jgi:hypothetical protein